MIIKDIKKKLLANKALKKLLFYSLLILLTACKVKPDSKNQNENKSPLEIYESYTKKGVFDSKQFLSDNSGTWICYKYEKDTLGFHKSNSEHNESFAKEFSSYFYFQISKDTLKYNIYKMPLRCENIKYKSLNNYTLKKINVLAPKDSSFSSLKNIYRIDGKEGMYYSDYYKKMATKGKKIPYIKSCPIGVSLWCFPDYIALNGYGYNWYYKKGKPNNQGIIGMPSNKNSRFVVEKVYSNCTIEQAFYKFIEDFPEGTKELFDCHDEEPDENGEYKIWFPTESYTPYGRSAEYIWKNKNKLIITDTKGKNSTFMFDFVKKGTDVHVKYWNKVVFPSEPGYRDSW